jgi:hypothetical protein
MGANTQQFASTSTSEPDQTVTLTFSSDAESPGSQLTFSSKFVFIDKAETIRVTVAGAKLPESNSQTLIFPAGGSSDLAVARDGEHQATITAEEPTHYLRSWALTFNVDVSSTNEPVIMTSPTLYIVRGSGTQPALGVELKYLSNGNFELDAAVDLASLLVLVNPHLPFALTFNLSSDLGGVTFHSSPILWAGPPPAGVTVDPLSPTEVKLSIDDAPDRLGAFRFVIDVPTSDGTITVTSPDPILVNATIGDG